MSKHFNRRERVLIDINQMDREESGEQKWKMRRKKK